MTREWTTERLVLRELGPEYSGDVRDYGLRSREFLAPWEAVRPSDWWDQAQVASRLTQDVIDIAADRSLPLWISLAETPERIVGSIALRNIIRGAMHGCHVGYGLAPEAVGRGFMTEALMRVVRIGFEELNLHRVEANIIPRNVRSLRVAEKCGFRREGVCPRYLRINGVWEDHIRLAVTNDDWSVR